MTDPKMFSMDWCMKMAGLEGNAEIGAGALSDPGLDLARRFQHATRDDLLLEVERLRAIIAGLTDNPEWDG